MAIIPCPECGKQISDRAISCPECGCPINAAPAVVDNSKEIEKLITLARRARESSDDKNAKKYYDQILEKDPGNWEAIFFSVYHEANECKIRDIGSAANAVSSSIGSAFAAIADLQDEGEKDFAIDTILSASMRIAGMLANGAVSHYNQFPTVNGAFGECANRVVLAGNIYAEIETCMKRYFPEKRPRLMIHQKTYVNYLHSHSKWYKNEYLINTYNRLGNEIRMVDPSFQTPVVSAGTGGGCYVATAVYGSYDCPEVWTLRRYRDYTLAETWYGRAFIHTYYAISPTLVKWFGHSQWFKNMWKPTLDKMVAKLRSQGVEDVPYEDRPW